MSLDIESPAPESVEPSSPAPESAPSSMENPGVGAEGTPDAPPAPPAYTPNFKFKVMDKEHEFDDFVRGAVKDQETEKKIRELYEKAYGLDVVKPRFTELRDKHKAVETQHNQLMSDIKTLREHYVRGDFDSFFQNLKIPQEKILQWVLDKANYNELPPEQKRIFDDRRSADHRAWEAEKRAEALEQQMHERIIEAKGSALQVALAKPDIKSFADAFDQQAKKPGAFMEAVYQAGDYAWRSRNEDLSPEQAIQAVMAQYGVFLQVPGNGAPQGAPQGSGAPQAGPGKEPPVIPNVGGRSASPASPTLPKSIADLKKKRDQMLSS
jgi:hypothetical protein